MEPHIDDNFPSHALSKRPSLVDPVEEIALVISSAEPILTAQVLLFLDGWQ